MSDELQRAIGDILARLVFLEKTSDKNDARAQEARLTRIEERQIVLGRMVRWLMGIVSAAGAFLFGFFAKSQGWF